MHSTISGLRRHRQEIIGGFFVALVTAAAFLPVVANGWVNWDDDRFILANPHLRLLNQDNLRWMATTILGGTYQPLGWLSYALDFKLWGSQAHGFHMTSVLWHALNASLVYALTLRLLRLAKPDEAAGSDGVVAAVIGALLFSLHPLRVESVAWLSNRREQIAAAFYLGGVVAYLHAPARPGFRGWRAACAALIALSALAKALAITAPAALLVLDWYPLRRLPGDPLRWSRADRGVLLEKIPFLLISGMIAVLGYSGNALGHATLGWSEYGLGHRLAQCGFGLIFYAAKTIWPARLSPLYEIPRHFSPLEPRFVACWATVAIATALGWRARSRHPQWLAAWLCYALMLAPFLGLAQSGRVFAADRYSLLACLSWSTLAAAGWLSAAKAGSATRTTASLLAGALIVALACATVRQISFWHDSLSLWTRAVALEPDSATARDNLGSALALAGRLTQARAQFEAALRADPDCLPPTSRVDRECNDAWINLSTTQAALGDWDGAIIGFRQALAQEPANAQAQANLARALRLRAGHFARLEGHGAPGQDQGREKDRRLAP